jgi:hypothetical protein
MHAGVHCADADQELLEPALAASALIPLVCYAESQLWLQQQAGSADVDFEGGFIDKLALHITRQIEMRERWDNNSRVLAYRSGCHAPHPTSCHRGIPTPPRIVGAPARSSVGTATIL